MSDLAGESLVKLSDWFVALADSGWLEIVLLACALVVILGAVRWWRWDQETRERDAAAAQERRQRVSRPDDV